MSIKEKTIKFAQDYLNSITDSIPASLAQKFQAAIDEAKTSPDWAEILQEMAEDHKEFLAE
jgi:hypothetical protein